MSIHTISKDLNEESNQLKEKIYKDSAKKRNIWMVDGDLRKHHDLTFDEAGLFGMVSQLQCVKEGFCRAKNYYFLDSLGKSDDWLERALKKLSSKGLIWSYVYNTKNGRRRHIVTASSIRSYQRYLASHKSWNLLKKFQQEFVVLQAQAEPSEPPPSNPKKAPQPIETKPPSEGSHRPSRKMRDGPPRKMRDAINTTYLPDKQNDGTCKGSDEPSVAVSFEERMRKELECSYSKADVDIMMQWYGMQTEAKKNSMKKPIACVINAHKEGYAQQEVASKNREVAQQLQQQEKIKLQKAEKKQEENQNKKLADQLIEKFSHINVWSHSIDAKGFSLTNEGVEKGVDYDQGCNLSYYILPSGKKCYGKKHFTRVSFDLPHEEFRKTLRDFFNEAQWKTDVERKTA